MSSYKKEEMTKRQLRHDLLEISYNLSTIYETSHSDPETRDKCDRLIDGLTKKLKDIADYLQKGDLHK